MIVHIHFHSHKTGVTRSVENIIPVLNKYSEALVFGYGIDAPKISLSHLLKLVYSDDNLVIHAHRNNEIIFALLLRAAGRKIQTCIYPACREQTFAFYSMADEKSRSPG